MARALSQYLRIYDAANTTLYRWQSYYANKSVTWAGASWIFIPFMADGITAGISGDEANVSITAPATSLPITAFETSISAGHIAELSIYQFDTNAGNNEPQAGQLLIASYTGQVVNGSATLTSITINLGSALSPVGAQMPPRKFTSAIMGVGCRL